MSFQLVKKIIITGEVIAESGIMIGGSNSAFEIGGTDKQVIRNPINKMPYIPGSSLKGKMRSLFELNQGTVSKGNNGFGPTHNPQHIAAQLFGHIKHREDNDNKSQQASRVIVRDGELNNSNEFEGKTESLYTEIKAENSIDRITSAANPRFFERVPKGARFDLNIVINIFSQDKNGDRFLSYVFDSLKLVQDDYLGGSGSRGNGQVRFEIKEVVSRSVGYYTGTEKEVPLNNMIPDELKVKEEANA